MPCFDLSGFLGLSQDIKVTYKTWWDTFERVQAFDSNVSTFRAENKKVPGFESYYVFSSTERTQFLGGRMLHIRRYPTSNWTPVERN